MRTVEVLFFISLLFHYIYLSVYLKHELHMLQQNSYMNIRYLRWYKKFFKPEYYFKPLILLFLVPVIYLGYEWMAFITAIVYILILLITYHPKKEIKKFVITTRVIRLIISCFLILAANIYLGICVYYKNMFSMPVYFTLQYLLLVFPQIIILVANTINKPIECLIKQYYINDAKKMVSEKSDLIVIGITGSYGKTSTKYILKTILEERYNVLITPESYNTTMGVVRTIREKLKPIHDVFIVEMGAKRPGDIKEICNIVNPQYAIITTIGNQHLETFKTLDNIRKTKLELFDSLPSFGVAFVNKDDVEIMKGTTLADKKYVYYSMFTEDADYYLSCVKYTQKGSEFEITKNGGDNQVFSTKLLGKNNVSNILSAVSCANTLGIPLEEIKYRINQLEPVSHRLELKRLDSNTYIIDDAFNSNEKGSEEALRVLQGFEKSYKFLITPGMVELGELEEKINYEFGKKAAKSADQIILVGKKQTQPIFEGIKDAGFNIENVTVVNQFEEALKIFNQKKQKDNVILLENDLPDLFME